MSTSTNAAGVTFSTTDNVDVTNHAERMWTQRFPADSRSLRTVWQQATPVANERRAPLLSARYTRVCPQSAALLITHHDRVVTVLYAGVLSRSEQGQIVAQTPVTREQLAVQAADVTDPNTERPAPGNADKEHPGEGIVVPIEP
jgi:hypothetical protein